MKINASINDFSPLLRSPEYLFKGLKDAGVDGIELGLGFKSRWSFRHFKSLSEKYKLPIASMHQPLWSVLGISFDEGFFKTAIELDVKHIICHPLPKISFKNKRMKNYLKRLSAVQKETGIEILVENLPEQYNHKILNYFFPPDKNTGNILDLYEAVNEFDLKMTLDIDHLQLSEPHKELWLKTILPKIGNIHLSSFDKKNRHLPLYMGDFESVAFFKYLKKVKYKGLLTLEINYPGSITFINYDFNTIKKSLAHLKSY